MELFNQYCGNDGLALVSAESGLSVVQDKMLKKKSIGNSPRPSRERFEE
jgi:hypothetical protein